MGWGIESGYYPPGAEFDPNAPYNQVDPPTHCFDVTMTLTLSDGSKKELTQYMELEYFDEEMDNEDLETEMIRKFDFGDEDYEDYEISGYEEL